VVKCLPSIALGLKKKKSLKKKILIQGTFKCPPFVDCILWPPHLYVEVLTPKVMIFGGEAFGTQLPLDEVMKMGSP
jgi:hypothetical protein